MSSFLTDYGLFLTKTLTVLLAVLAVILALAFLAARRGRSRRGHLEVRNVNARYDQLARTLQARILPKQAFRQQLRADRRRRRAQRRRRPREDGPRRRLFVVDFRGDVRASQASALREEVTAILTVARPSDEVLVRLENPGGLIPDQGFAASQLLRLRQRDISLTVAVDRVAASGGYMMACVADRILAAPFAVVGSIGVIAQLPNFHRLLDRHGIDFEQFKGGRFKRTVTLFGENTDADRAKYAEEIEAAHDLFQQFVAAQRPQLDIAAVATGEHWYGSRALELGLVDELQTSDDYLLEGRERADIYHVQYRRARPLGRRLGAGIAGLADRMLTPS